MLWRFPRWLLFGVMIMTVSLFPGAGIYAQPKAALVDLNKASVQELEALKGVGPVTAKKIVAARPYQSVAELTKAGLDAKQIDALKPLVTAGPAPKSAPAAAAPEKPAKPAQASKLIDLNTASRADLETLPGIGKTSADKIIAGRPYAKLDDLVKAGIAEKNISVLKPLVTISEVKGTPGPEAAKKPAALVDLNKASQTELEALPGIGKSKARKIMASRPFTSVNDLAKAGLNEKQIGELKALVTLSAAPTAAPAKPAPAATPPAKPAPAAPPAAAPVTPPAKPEAPAKAAPAPKLAPGQKVNLNSASKELLEALPDIGPVKAQAIIDNRPYQKIEDVMKVKGIKEGTFEAIKDHLTVN